MEKIGRYRILEELGRGASGVVYRAQDPAIGRVIAIKTIRLSDLTDPPERERMRERLFREAQSAGILSHPHIVTIYDIAEESGMAYIFMEFVNGPSLEKLMAGGEPPDKAVVLSVLRQAAGALDYAHRKGIVHRDIKPANIMIQDDGQVKITDFGVAKILSQQMTQSGGMMGTPNYMSPEQVQGQAVDGQADQFALGVIAYELLTGEKPFLADYLPALLYKIVREDPAPPERINPTLGPPVGAALAKALAKEAAGRYGSCSEFVATLERACDTSPNWRPLPRGASQSMPTVAGAAVDAARRLALGNPVSAPTRPRLDETDERNPLLRSAIWVLVGIGLVGLVLLGVQRLLFNPNPPAEMAKQASEPAAPPQATPTPELEKPSAMGQPPAPEPAADANSAREPQPRATSGSNSGTERSVQMITDPPGAAVVVDGNASVACRAPCMLSLTPGRHTLTAQLDGYRPYPRIFNVPQESDVFLKLARAAGTLSVTSTPPSAVIQIDGEEQKQRTPASFAVAPGTYHVRVIREGAHLDFDVDIKDGEFKNRNVNFQ